MVGLSIKFEISLKSASNSIPDATFSADPNTRTETNLNNANTSAFSFYNNDSAVTDELKNKLDTEEGDVKDVSTIKMVSYIGSEKKQTINLNGSDYTYYKKAEFVYKTSSNTLKFLKVGSTTVDVITSITNNNKTQYADIGSTGKAVFAITDAFNATVTLYFQENTNSLSLSTQQFGTSNYEYSTTLNVTGIDVDAPSGPFGRLEDPKGYERIKEASGDLSSARWWTNNSFNPTATDTASATANEAPLAWFYYVNKADSLDKLPKEAIDYSTLKSIYVGTSKITPFAVGTKYSPFVFDFANGYAAGTKDGANTAYGHISGESDAVTSAADVKGSGYYRFDFYVFDLAGNNGQKIVTYFVKVDCDPVSQTLKYEYVSGEDNTSTKELKSSDVVGANAKWAYVKSAVEDGKRNIDVTLTFELAGSYAGNTLLFRTFNNLGNEKMNAIKLQPYGAGLVEGQTINFYESVYGTQLDVAVTVTPSGKGDNKCTMTLKFSTTQTAPDAFAFDTTFVLVKGLVDGVPNDLKDAYVAGEDYAIAEGWGSVDTLAVGFTAEQAREQCAHFYFDCALPETPTFSKASGSDASAVNYQDMAEAKSPELTWITDIGADNSGMAVAAKLGFRDGIVGGSVFKSGLKIYIAEKVFNGTVEAFNDFLGWVKENPSFYKTLTAGNIATTKFGDDGKYGAFDLWITPDGGAITGDSVNMTDANRDIKMNLKNSVGLHFIIVWAEDQAGLISPTCSMYAILLDPSDYTVSTELVENADYLPSGGVTFTVNGNNEAQVKRGSEVALSVNFTDSHYVPYKLSINDNGVSDVLLLENYTATNAWKAASTYNNEFDGYDFSGGKCDMAYTLNGTSLGKLDSGVKFSLYKRFVLTSYEIGFADAESAATFYTSVYNKQDQQIVVRDITTDIKLTETVKNNIKKAFLFELRDEDGKPKYKEGVDPQELVKPHNAGAYTVYAYIPYNNDYYVTNNIMVTADGSPDIKDGVQQVNSDDIYSVTIQKRAVQVQATATTTTYGEDIKLALDQKSVGALKDADSLDGEGFDAVGAYTLSLVTSLDWTQAATLLPVGSYTIAISVDPEKCPNYTVTLSGGIQHTVNKRTINIETRHSSKVYGDEGEIYNYAVKQSELTWENKATAISSGTIDEKALLRLLFTSPTSEIGEPDGGEYKFTISAALGYITRQNADKTDVGTYAFNTDNTLSTIIGGNFEITLAVPTENDSNGQFEITQRTVTLKPSANSTEDYVESLDLNLATNWTKWEDILNQRNGNSNTLDLGLSNAGDIRLQAEILAAILEKGLVLDRANPGDKHDTSNQYHLVYNFFIYFADGTSSREYETKNIKFVIDDTSVFEVRVAKGTSVIVESNKGELTFVFGNEWNGNSIKYSKEGFSARRADSEKIYDFDNIVWTVQLYQGNTLISDKYPKYGNYSARFTGAKLMKGGVEVKNEGKEIIVNVREIRVVYNRATIEIEPTYTSLEKTYGDPDSAYGIGWRISKVNETTITKEMEAEYKLANYTYQQLLASFAGTYVRAVYQDSRFVAFGQQFDNATDETDFSVYNANYYYGFYISSPFASKANMIEGVNLTDNLDLASGGAKLNSDVRFKINPKQITLYSKEFKGVNKNYDGTDEVKFGDIVAYDLSEVGKYRARIEDVISLVYQAKYDQTGAPNATTHVGIIFHGLELEGASAKNYTLFKIVTDGDSFSELVDGAESSSKVSELLFGSSDPYLTIFKLDLTGERTEDITIGPITIKVNQNEFSISKVYDGTFNLSLDNISFHTRVEGEASTGGNAVLYDAFNAEERTGVTLVSRVDGNEAQTLAAMLNPNVGRRQISFVLRFYMEYAKGFKVEPSTGVGFSNGTDPVKGDYIDIVFTGITAEITPLTITADHLTDVDAVDRQYNKSEDVSITYSYKDRMPDGVAAIGLNLKGKSESPDAGTHSVSITGATVVNSNYAVDEDSIKAIAGIDVVISKAKLVLNATFADRNYDGTLGVTVNWHGEGETVTVSNPEDRALLADELAAFKLSYTRIILSKNGEENFDVNLDENGNVIPHNVMIEGFKITEEGGYKYFRNYEIDGYEYVDGDYKPATVVTSGNEHSVNKLELIAQQDPDTSVWSGPMTLHKNVIPIYDINVKVADKVYDGSTSVDIHIDIPENTESEIYVAAADKEYLSIVAAAEFIRPNVGTNVAILFTQAPTLVYSAEGVRDVSRTEDILNNYEQLTVPSNVVGNILAKPLPVTFSVADRIYDGTAEIKSAQLSYNFDYSHFIVADQSSYTMQVKGGAYYTDKNVALQTEPDGSYSVDEAGFNIPVNKNGAVFDPVLRNTRTGIVNYVPVYASSEKAEGYIAYKLSDGTLKYYVKAEGGEDVKEYYYPLLQATKYVEAKDKPATEKDIISTYMLGEETVYVVADDYNADGVTVHTFAEPVTYVPVSGKIEQKEVRLNSNAINIVNAAKLNKQYDGTKKYYGTYPEDFTYDPYTAINGIVPGDNVLLDYVNAEFNAAGVDASAVVFTVGALKKSGDYLNYKVNVPESALVTQRVASIGKRDIYAHLQDTTMEYGTLINNGEAPSDIVKYTYSMDEEGKHVIVEYLTQLYIKYNDFAAAVGMPNDTQFEMARYTGSAEDGFTMADNAAIGDNIWVQLGGIIYSLPGARIEFATARPYADDVSTSYTLSGGEASYFNFVGVYTSDGTSKVTVTKRHVYIYPDTLYREYTGIYGISWKPNVSLYVSDEDEKGAPSGINGLAPWDSVNLMFVINNVNYAPSVEWYEIDGNNYGKKVGTGEGEAYPEIGKTYVARLMLSASVFSEYYNNKEKYPILYSYDFHIAEGGVIGDGTISKAEEGYFSTYKLAKGTSVNVPTATLKLELPSGDSFGVSVPQDAYSFTYFDPEPDTESKLYNKNYVDPGYLKDQNLRSAVLGVVDTDVVGMEDEEGNEIDVIDVKRDGSGNVIPYVGYITLKRQIFIDDNDPHKGLPEYTAVWKSAVLKSITINPAVINVTAKNVSGVYGVSQSYEGEVSLDGDDVTVLNPTNNIIATNIPYWNEMMYTTIVYGSSYYVRLSGEDLLDSPYASGLKKFAHGDAGTYTVYVGGFGSDLLKQIDEHYGTKIANNYVMPSIENEEFGDIINFCNDLMTVPTFDGMILMTTATYTIRPAIIDVALSGNDQLTEDGVVGGVKRFVGKYSDNAQYQVDYRTTFTDALEDWAKAPFNGSTQPFLFNFTREGVEGADQINAPGRYSFNITLPDELAGNFQLRGNRGLLELYSTQLSVTDVQNEQNGEVKVGANIIIDPSNSGNVIANRLIVHEVNSKGVNSDQRTYTRINSYMPKINNNARISSILEVSLYYDNTRINVTGTKMTVQLSVPSAVGASLDEVAIYMENEDATLSKLSYTLTDDGYIEYETTYLGAIVFVNISQPTLPSWLLYTIIGVGALIALAVVWVLMSIIIRKARLGKLRSKV